ncbi:MAG: hypothetical protein ABIR30_09985 [Chitinophagaceae bacterium]
MKKTLLLATVLILACITTYAQLKPQPLKKLLELKMPKTAEDDMPGTRGASVSWHPVQRKYYASFAGNAGYPLGVFDEKAKLLSGDEQTTMADTRGLWYDPVTKLICGNSYNDGGWFSYKLEKTGIPSEIIYTNDGMNQPNGQCAGTYNPLAKRVLFLQASQVFMYNNTAELQDSLVIHWGRSKADGVEEDEDPEYFNEDYNSTTLVYTGIKGQELGFLNITNKQVELYDIKTGFLTKTLSFPETAITEPTFNFAYANGIYWLFNMELRKWVGYK